MSKNIVLIGFMGAGKTRVSSQLAKILKRPWISTDEGIEKQEKRSVSQIFQESGETYFRRLEKDIVREIAQKQNLILDCGGGVVLQPENLANLKKTGILFYLSASPETLYERIKHETHRPLLQGPDPLPEIRKLLEQRKVFYEQSDYTITTDHRSVDEIVQEVLTQILLLQRLPKGPTD